MKTGNGRKKAINKTLYTLIKLPLKDLIHADFNITVSHEAAIEKEYLIKQSDSLFFRQVERLRGCKTEHVKEVILMVAKKNPRQEEHLRYILEHGFCYNGTHYSRFGKSASQGKDGITAFVCDAIFDRLYRISQMDIPVESCVISKYEAGRCLLFSSCTPIDNYVPNIVIVDEYKKIIPRRLIRYVVEREREFKDPETGAQGTYLAREIEEGYRDIPISPFDGCGCHEARFARHVNRTLQPDSEPAGYQIRMPFLKGYSVMVPFHRILREWGYDTITDIYGCRHPVETIDCIWNISMFKGHKLFWDTYGSQAWQKYMETFRKYEFQLGISKYSHHTGRLNKKSRLNFQYIQCLDLWNSEYIRQFEDKQHQTYDILDPDLESPVISIARYTTALYERIINGETFYTFKFMGLGNTGEYDPQSRYLEAALINQDMLRDPAVRQFICRKLSKYINDAKVGKIYADGFYHTAVGDMIGYLQYAAGQEPSGCLNAHECFCRTLSNGQCLSLRSPLVCPSEVNRITLTDNPVTAKWFGHLKDQDIVMFNMHDLSAPQQGGMDYDGDLVFLCNDPDIIRSKINKPIIIDLEDKATAIERPYTPEHLINYEVLTRDSRIGEITNVATSIENKYVRDQETAGRYADYASLLRIFQGKEIDFLKTGFRWHLNAGLRKHLKQLPYFLLYNYPEKLKTYRSLREKGLSSNAYHSPSPMNELCDYICTWEKKHIIWNRDTSDTAGLVTNPAFPCSDRKVKRIVRRAINDYASELRICLNSEEKYRHELISGKYRKRLLEELQMDETTIANYVIAVSYASRSISKSLAWSVYGSFLIDNLRQNSAPEKGFMIEQAAGPSANTYEYLGNYYTLERRSQ